jgi:uncharacterized protein
MELAGYIGALFIGLLLGITGSGGSILALPLLVGLFGMSAFDAVGSSLFIVAVTSLFGAGLVIREKAVDWRAFLWFGLPSVVSIISVRRGLMPLMPEIVFGLHRDILVVVVFAAIMVVAAMAMLRPSRAEPKEGSPAALIGQGLFVGAIAGFVGAGGGFMIVPALVLFAGLPIKRAAATSIVLIALNTGVGFLASLGTQHFNWPMLWTIVGIAVVGLMIGRSIAHRIDQRVLKVGFAYFVLLVAAGLLIQTFS